MRLSVRTVVPLALALIISRASATQQFVTAPIDSGTVIRIHLSKTESVRGRLLQTFTPASSTLTFCRYPGIPCSTLSDKRMQGISALQITGLDVVGGTNVVKGAVIGGVIGGLVASFFLYWGHGLCDTSECGSQTDRTALGALALGLGIGLAFGSQSVKWQRVDWRPGQ